MGIRGRQPTGHRSKWGLVCTPILEGVSCFVQVPTLGGFELLLSSYAVSPPLLSSQSFIVFVARAGTHLVHSPMVMQSSCHNICRITNFRPMGRWTTGRRRHTLRPREACDHQSGGILGASVSGGVAGGYNAGTSFGFVIASGILY